MPSWRCWNAPSWGRGAGGRAAAIGAVQGMPGVGKSYLAARFAALHGDDLPGGVVRITFAADDTRGAEAVARDLCDQLRLRVAGPGSVWELLAGYLRGNGMLLIVENADAEPQAQAAAGLAAGLRGSTLIVTGRYQRLGRTAGAGWMPVTVTPFDEPHALAELAGEHRPPAGAAETADYLKLVRTLGYLPLAIIWRPVIWRSPARHPTAIWSSFGGAGWPWPTRTRRTR